MIWASAPAASASTPSQPHTLPLSRLHGPTAFGTPNSSEHHASGTPIRDIHHCSPLCRHLRLLSTVGRTVSAARHPTQSLCGSSRGPSSGCSYEGHALRTSRDMGFSRAISASPSSAALCARVRDGHLLPQARNVTSTPPVYPRSTTSTRTSCRYSPRNAGNLMPLLPETLTKQEHLGRFELLIRQEFHVPACLSSFRHLRAGAVTVGADCIGFEHPAAALIGSYGLVPPDNSNGRPSRAAELDVWPSDRCECSTKTPSTADFQHPSAEFSMAEAYSMAHVPVFTYIWAWDAMALPGTSLSTALYRSGPRIAEFRSWNGLLHSPRCPRSKT